MAVLSNPWANPMIGGPRKIGSGESITGFDALDGLIRGWVAVETVQTQKKLANAKAEQAATIRTVERPQQVGAEPIPPGRLAPPAPQAAAGGMGPFRWDQIMTLMLVGAVVYLVAR